MSPQPASGRAVVLTADQRRSRSTPDAVPEVLERLSRLTPLRPFERTAGDELQGVLADGASLAAAVELLLRDGRWHVGLGVGEVELPLPPHSRAGRGPAFLAAREAVGSTRAAPWHLRVDGDVPVARHLESALWLWAALLGRRSEKGWEVVDLVDAGASYEAAGEHLGISQSAVSQRAAAAGLAEGRRGRELVAALADRCLEALP